MTHPIKIYLILLGLLLIRFLWFYSQMPVRQVGQIVEVSGQLEAEPIVTKGSYKLDLQGVRVYLPVKDVYHYGDYILISGLWNGRYLEMPQVIKHVTAGKSRHEADIREKLRQVYFSILPARQADIIAGMVLGSLELDSQLKNDLANVGLIHLVVASGMNLTLLGGFLMALFTGFRAGRTIGVVGMSFAVIGYAGLTGFNPPVVRALIMFEAVLLGSLMGRKSGGLFALVTAGYIMLWVSPGLATSYSFLLSFASMIGQIFVSTFKLSLPNLVKPFILVVMQNFFAIVFTLPIILVGFAKFSLVSMISNLLVVLTVEPLMIGGAIAGIVGLVSLELARMILVPLAFVLQYFLWVVEVFGVSEKFVMKIEDFNLSMGIGYYLILFVSIYYFKNRKVVI